MRFQNIPFRNGVRERRIMRRKELTGDAGTDDDDGGARGRIHHAVKSVRLRSERERERERERAYSVSVFFVL